MGESSSKCTGRRSHKDSSPEVRPDGNSLHINADDKTSVLVSLVVARCVPALRLRMIPALATFVAACLWGVWARGIARARHHGNVGRVRDVLARWAIARHSRNALPVLLQP